MAENRIRITITFPYHRKLHFAKTRRTKFISGAVKAFLSCIDTFVHLRHMTYTAIVGLSGFTLQEFSINSNKENEVRDKSRGREKLRDSIFILACVLQQFVYDIVDVVSSTWLSQFRLLLC